VITKDITILHVSYEVITTEITILQLIFYSDSHHKHGSMVLRHFHYKYRSTYSNSLGQFKVQ